MTHNMTLAKKVTSEKLLCVAKLPCRSSAVVLLRKTPCPASTDKLSWESSRWRGRFLFGGDRRRAALTAPLPAAPHWRSWRRLRRAAAVAAE